MHAQRLALATAAVCALWQSGCALVAPTAQAAQGAQGAPAAQGDKGPAVSYGGGRAIQEFAIPADDVGAALSAAMDDLKMTSIKHRRNGAIDEITAATHDNRPVLVTLRPHDWQTRVSCRIGWLGDEPLARALLERAGVRLGILPPAAIPENPPSAPAKLILPRASAPDDQTLRNWAEAPYRDRVEP